jgi:hypothetical protein
MKELEHTAYHPSDHHVVAERLAFLMEAWGWTWSDRDDNKDAHVPTVGEIEDRLVNYVEDIQDASRLDEDDEDEELRSYHRIQSTGSGGIHVVPRYNEENPRNIDEYEIYLRVGTL